MKRVTHYFTRVRALLQAGVANNIFCCSFPTIRVSNSALWGCINDKCFPAYSKYINAPCSTTARAVRDSYRSPNCPTVEPAFLALPVGIDDRDERLTELSRDKSISGISLLRSGEATVSLIRAIQRLTPKKDIESIHPASIGHLFSDPETSECMHPLTAAVMATLTTHEIEIYGSTILIQANPRMVGLPLIAALAARHATTMSGTSR